MLEFRDVSFNYRPDNEDLFQHLSFKVEPGSFVAIVGASGCGKSTIFRLINGLEAIQTGAILRDGVPITESGDHSNAFMPQKDLLLPWRTIGANVELPMELQGVPAPERKRRALEVLDQVGLSGQYDATPRELSGGMRQRAAFARALMEGSDPMLLDEPFSALDYLTRVRLQVWLQEQWMRDPRTILFVTHDIEEAIFLAERILVMEGRPVQRIREVKVPLGFPRTEADLEREEIRELKSMLFEALCPTAMGRADATSADPARAEGTRVAAAGTGVAVADVAGAGADEPSPTLAGIRRSSPTPTDPRKKRAMDKALRYYREVKQARPWLPPSIGIGLLVVWQLLGMWIGKPYILPTPIQVLAKLWDLRAPLFGVHLPATMGVTAIGLAISLVLGVGLAVLMAWNQTWEEALYPVIVTSQTIPTTAIAPLFVLWFGYSIWSKVLVTILITFFPIVINVHSGLKGVKREQIELFLSMGATRSQIFWKLSIPSALPMFLASIKMAIPLSIIGAAIAEWLGAQAGLGYFSKRMITQLDGAGVFAPVVLLSVVALVLVKLVGLLEKKSLRWQTEL